MCCSVFFFFSRTHRSGVHPSLSQRKQKSSCQSNTFSLRHASCQPNTLLVTTTVDVTSNTAECLTWATAALRRISDERRMAHDKNTDSVSF